ncbi:type II toxin-antitoxin system prevent-host-death family antitoxin [Agrobacterium tumefaciens]|uniref:type II toxin-antitoxin system prevent-host-death family antitoxin n=1 Tax=Agrobacterium tumefaciens TaxID=358 RepID=UPI0015749ABD|nr:type II toxin-antitoxin system Phd/YefM family antitoxin [Agrobacterium tumefaciens]
MTMTCFSCSEVDLDVSKAKEAAQAGPVIITDRGRPSHVLMTKPEFERLTGKRRNLVDDARARTADRHQISSPCSAI